MTLALCMLVTMFPMQVSAEITEIASGTCGESVNWSLDSEGILTISGQGTMTNYTSSGSNAFAPWYEYRDSISEVRIESGVTSIGDYAFNYYYPNIQKVSVADTVTCVGDQTFCYDSEMVGDVNGDGMVNGKDGILLSQYLAEWGVTINMDAADVNGDGKVNGKDGVLLAQYLAEWNVVLH